MNRSSRSVLGAGKSGGSRMASTSNPSGRVGLEARVAEDLSHAVLRRLASKIRVFGSSPSDRPAGWLYRTPWHG
jgi:hypothetical protein